MLNFNRERTRRISTLMFVFCVISTAAAIVAIYFYSHPGCGSNTNEETYWPERASVCLTSGVIGAGIWGALFTWPAAVLARLAARKDSAKCLIIGHLVMCIFSSLLSIPAFIANMVLTSEWVGILYSPDAYEMAVRNALLTSTVTLFALSILSLVSAGFSCNYVCCKTQPSSSTDDEYVAVPPAGTSTGSNLIGIQVIKNGEMKYFPANNRQVSEIVTDSGRMLVLNLPEENDPTTSLAPPSYESISNIQPNAPKSSELL